MFTDILENQHWSVIKMCYDVDDSLDCFISMLTAVLNRNAPLNKTCKTQ